MNQTASDFFWLYYFFCDFPTIVEVNFIKLLQDTDIEDKDNNITVAILVKVLLNLPQGSHS